MVKLIVSVNKKEMISKAYEMGADEVVVSMKQGSFNALEKMDLKDVNLEKPISIFFNCLLFPNEVNEHYELFKSLLSYPIESIYFQDPIIISWAKEMNCLEKCIYRPETLVVNSMDAKWWYERGLKSVSISPLITLEETKNMIQMVPNSECIIHGHLMMAESKRYLVSAFTNHHHLLSLKNNYDLSIQEAKRDGHMPIFEDDYGTLVYTDYVLESFHELPLLIKQGASRMFINGEFLKEEELLDTTNIYHQIIEGDNVSEKIEEYFLKYKDTSFSKGYYEEKTIQ